MSVPTVLTGHDLFKLLAVEEVDKISRFSSLKQYRKGQVVYEHNQLATHAYVLVKGAVHLRLPARPNEFNLVVSKVTEKHFFGLAPLLGYERYTVTAVAVEDSDVLAIEGKPFRALLRDNCLAGFHIMSEVAQGYSERYMEVLTRLQAILNQIPLIA